jgi:hypothetical protein
MILRKLLVRPAIAGLLLFQGLVAATVNLNYESAPSADGPWVPVEAGAQVRQADGSISIDAAGSRFYRLRIEGTDVANPSSSVRLGALPETAAKRLAFRLPELGRFLRPVFVAPPWREQRSGAGAGRQAAHSFGMEVRRPLVQCRPDLRSGLAGRA